MSFLLIFILTIAILFALALSLLEIKPQKNFFIENSVEETYTPIVPVKVEKTFEEELDELLKGSHKEVKIRQNHSAKDFY